MGNQQQPAQPSYYSLAKQAYSDLVQAIIRPPRCQYAMAQLGPSTFVYGGRQFQRIDFHLTNPRGLKIMCSLWEPTPECRHNPVLPCVIYMHGNSSARVEALTQLSLVLSLGATLVSFDFTGSGKSEGDWVSLGAFEKDDLKCVIEHLRGLGTTSTIALWGRSMGAATALLHGERDPSIAGMILDSAFADLQMLAEEMVEKGRQHGLFAPNFLVSIAIRMIRGSVQEKAHFDIRTLCPIEHADKCFIPAMFVAAEGDDFVPPHHSQKIYQKYAGDKNILIVEGDHNSARPRFLFDSASIFLTQCLQIPPDWLPADPSASNKVHSTLPWGGSSTGGGSHRRPSPHAASLAGGRREGGAPPAAAAGADGDDVGMTAARQQHIRDKLYSMLGDRGAASAATSATSASSSSSSSASAAASTAAGRSGKPPSDAPPPAPSTTASAAAPPAIVSPPVPADDAVVQSEQAGAEPEWTCSRCTLINSSIFEVCFACDAPRSS